MSPLFKKLNLKDQKTLLLLDAPESFEDEIAALEGVAVHRNARKLPTIEFVLAFVKTLAEVEAAAKVILPRAEADALVWLAYPKTSSKRYTCDFNRDTGWAALVEAGYETVRLIAIDEDWSAMRFRRTEFVKTAK